MGRTSNGTGDGKSCNLDSNGRQHANVETKHETPPQNNGKQVPMQTKDKVNGNANVVKANGKSKDMVPNGQHLNAMEEGQLEEKGVLKSNGSTVLIAKTNGNHQAKQVSLKCSNSEYRLFI